MFTSVIGALTSLLPKYFIFGSYVPVLIFSFINAGLTYLLSAWSRHAVSYLLTISTPLTISVAFVGTVVLAYVVSSINDFLREFLEGRYGLWPGILRRAFCANERRRRTAFESSYQLARQRRYLLERNINGWQETLRKAASTGAAEHAGVTGYDHKKDAAGLDLETLRLQSRETTTVTAVQAAVAAVQAAVDAMKAALLRYDTTADVQLASDHRDLLVVIATILSAAIEAEYDNATKLGTYFGTESPKPTRMGNIAAAMRSYAVGRYGMDLSIFFTRLQTHLVKSDDKAYPIVLDAKTQLDFLVACCWFSGATTLAWYVILLAQGGSLEVFLMVAAIGPLATVAFYYLAAENYISYAEVVRACVDLNRFALLRALDIPMPSSNREERRMWGALSRATLSHQEGLEMSYEHPPA